MTCICDPKVFIPVMYLIPMAQANAMVLLKKLEQCLDKIRALLEWRQLKREEARPDLPPSFTMDNHIEEDLQNEYSRFAAISSQLQTILNGNGSIKSTSQRAYIKDRLWQLDRQVRGLNLSGYLYPGGGVF
jgi:hypothetical protein